MRITCLAILDRVRNQPAGFVKFSQPLLRGPAVTRRDHHDQAAGEFRSLLDCFSDDESVNARHSIVDQNQRPRRARFVSLLEHLQRDRSVGHEGRLHAVAAEHFLKNLPAHETVVDHEDFESLQNRG